MNKAELQRLRLADLAVEDLFDALDSSELKEYWELRAQHPDFDLDSIERAAAALQLAAGIETEPLPERIGMRLSTAADEYFGARSPAEAGLPAPEPASVGGTAAGGRHATWMQYGGWLAAAASLIVSLGLEYRRHPASVTTTVSTVKLPAASQPQHTPDVPVPAPPSPGASLPAPGAREFAKTPRSEEELAAAAADDRTKFLREHRWLWQRAWRPGPDPSGERVTGDVIWDPKTQSGYMRFHGLRRNNPNVEQYQLWIFDARRDERYPVDGGVFDIHDTADGVVAFRSSLAVEVPLLFVVTVERRGGVVVSDRSRIAAVANSG